MSAFGARLAASLALVGVAAGIAGLGTYAGFTSATSAQPQNVSSGTLVVDVGATGSVTNRLDVDATDIAPGDTIERTVDLVNTGTLDFASLDMTTSAPVTSSLLDTDATNGLQMVIDSCSVAWTETAVGAGYTYS
ncbi:MAG: TasA family protein, partial [Gaiellaceae bacterium]